MIILNAIHKRIIKNQVSSLKESKNIKGNSEISKNRQSERSGNQNRKVILQADVAALGSQRRSAELQSDPVEWHRSTELVSFRPQLLPELHTPMYNATI